MDDTAPTDLAAAALPQDSIGLLEGLVSTRAIRRYDGTPIPRDALRAILFAATRAPSGSNRQPFRFLVLTDGPKAREAKRLVGEAARLAWKAKRERDGYDRGSGTDTDSPKARLARSMEHYVEHLHEAPVLILPCLVRYRSPRLAEGASIYPACQNILLAARALGYGGVITEFQALVERELRDLLRVPDEAAIAASITLGRPRGRHGPVRRRPLAELVFEEEWERSADWAIDPPGTQYTRAGPPRPKPEA
jgi:nitroreductase